LARIDEPIAGKRKLSDEVLEGGVESSLTEMSNEELMAKRSIWPAHRLLICVHLVLASDSIAISTVPPRRLARRRPLESTQEGRSDDTAGTPAAVSVTARRSSKRKRKKGAARKR
jgi:hypothetical protein